MVRQVDVDKKDKTQEVVEELDLDLKEVKHLYSSVFLREDLLM